MPNEILWGQRFQHTTVAYDKVYTILLMIMIMIMIIIIIMYDKDASKFGITYSTIDAIEDDCTPRLIIICCNFLKVVFAELQN